MCAIRFRVPLSLVHQDQPTTITTIYIFLWIQFSENRKKIIQHITIYIIDKFTKYLDTTLLWYLDTLTSLYGPSNLFASTITTVNNMNVHKAFLCCNKLKSNQRFNHSFWISNIVAVLLIDVKNNDYFCKYSPYAPFHHSYKKLSYTIINCSKGMPPKD